MQPGKLNHIVLLLCTLCTCTSYHYGPPNTEHVCTNMFPEGHHVDSQLSEPPFQILLSQNVYTPWEEVQVTLKANPGHYFRGFFMQARRADCSHAYRQEPLGTFTVLPGEQGLVKTLACLNHRDSAVSHKTNNTLSKAVFRWNAPATQVGHLFFVATVVKEQEIFWTNVKYVFMRDLSDKASKAEFCPTKSSIDPPDIFTTNSPRTTDKFTETTTCGCTSVSGCHLAVVTAILLVLKNIMM